MVSSKKKLDKFNGRKKQQTIVLITAGVLFIFVLLWGWYKTVIPKIPEIISLKDNWTNFELTAQEWQEETYIESVMFSFAHQTLTALVYSPDVDNQGIMVIVGYNGNMETMPRNRERPEFWDMSKEDLSDIFVGDRRPVATHYPISQNEWKIDSQEALNIFAQDNEILSCLGKASSPELSLSKQTVNEDAINVLVWELLFWRCPNKNSTQSYYLDAQTGERISPFSN